MVRTFGVEADPSKRIRAKQGKAIRDVRTMRGMSIADFAEAVGVTVGAVSQWETGRTSPRQHLQLKVATALDVPWSMLFGLDGQVA